VYIKAEKDRKWRRKNFRVPRRKSKKATECQYRQSKLKSYVYRIYLFFFSLCNLWVGGVTDNAFTLHLFVFSLDFVYISNIDILFVIYNDYPL
jgi:hypothetical protein